MKHLKVEIKIDKKIKRCYDCFYSSNEYPEDSLYSFWYCRHELCPIDDYGGGLQDEKTIPEWCTLPDCEVKMKKQNIKVAKRKAKKLRNKKAQMKKDR